MEPSQLQADDLTEKLFLEYGRRVRLFADRRIANSAVAEEVVQETLTRALLALREGRVQNVAAVPAFLFETARHICQHHQRSSGRAADALARFAHAHRADETLTPDGRIELEQRSRAVREALSRLTREDRDLLLWSYRDGQDTSSIAARLKIETGALRVRRHRALRRLREALSVIAGAGRGL